MLDKSTTSWTPTAAQHKAFDCAKLKIHAIFRDALTQIATGDCDVRGAALVAQEAIDAANRLATDTLLALTNREAWDE